MFPEKFLKVKTLGGGVVRKSLGQESGNFLNMISAFKKESTDRNIIPPTMLDYN